MTGSHNEYDGTVGNGKKPNREGGRRESGHRRPTSKRVTGPSPPRASKRVTPKKKKKKGELPVLGSRTGQGTFTHAGGRTDWANPDRPYSNPRRWAQGFLDGTPDIVSDRPGDPSFDRAAKYILGDEVDEAMAKNFAEAIEIENLVASDPEKAAEVDAWRRSLAFRKQLRSDKGKRKLQQFIDVAQMDQRTGMGVPPGVVENSPRWLRDAMNGEIFILDDHMAEVAAKRAVASKRATINPFEPFAPAGVVWFPNIMTKISPFIAKATDGLLGSGAADKAAVDVLRDLIENHLGWMVVDHPFLGGDALAGIAWKVEGKKVTIFWLTYDFYTKFDRARCWVERQHFFSETQAGRYSWDKVVEIFDIDPLYDLSLFHYWTCDSDAPRYGGCLRPDQPDAPFVTPFEATVFENEDQTSTLKTDLVVDEEMCQEMDDQMWFQISFGCEVLRLMGQEITRVVPVSRHTGGRDLERDIKKNLPQRGIRTFVLRRFGSGDDEESGIKRPRGPLTTRHPRRGSWHASKTQKGDPDCLHGWKGSSVRSTWRICQHCHRREVWHSPAIVGPDGAPWAYAVKIGLVVR